MNENEKLLLKINQVLDESNFTDELKKEINLASLNLFKKKTKYINPDKIIEIVFNYLDVPIGHNPKKRQHNLVLARQLSYFFIKKYNKLSLIMIGKLFNQDHSTVIHSIKTIKNLLDTDKEVRYIFVSIEKYILEELNSCKYS